MKVNKLQKPLVFSLLTFLLLLTGFGVGRWSVSDQELENQPEILIIYKSHFLQAQEYAQENKLGIWKEK